MNTKRIYFANDYSLIDGDKIVRGHKTLVTLGEFAIRALQKVKIIAMHIALSEEEADTLLDCIVDEFFPFDDDMSDFEDKLECIEHFLDYYLDRLPKSIQITDENESEKYEPDEDGMYPF